MRTLLMYKNRDFDSGQILSRRDKYRSHISNNFNLEQLLPWNEKDITRDLGLEIIFQTMSSGDELLYDVAKVAVLSSVTDIETIRYRQDIFLDCLKNAQVIRHMYQIAKEALRAEKENSLWVFTKSPSSILSRSVSVLEMFVGMLKKLRAVVDQNVNYFKSEAFLRLFTMLQKELTDEYFALIEEHLKYLKFRGGILISAQLGRGNKGKSFILRKSSKKRWFARLVGKKTKGHSFQINEQDDVGLKTFSDLKDAGLNLVAKATARSAAHVLSFFQTLHTELAFYIGCLNLHERIAEFKEPSCLPVPTPSGGRGLTFRGLYDLSLALNAGRKVVGNDLNADGKNFLIITGANTGGKSTFLRSIGIAHLMMRAGMFVPAGSFSSETCNRIFTHYKREEDRWMEKGKWDEELGRLSAIVDHLRPNSLLLLNESFASTNEREGSRIADQIVKALLEKHIKIFFVTHLYSFAENFYDQKHDDVVFLRAERLPDGTRPFKLTEAPPQQTSYGEDLYTRIFSSERS